MTLGHFMSSESSPETTGSTSRSALLATAFFAFILVGIWVTLYSRHIEATSCKSQSESSRLKTVAGVISKHPSHSIPYYLSSADQKVVLSNYSRRSVFNETLKNSIGQNASATFCGDELLSLDIEGERVFTKDTSYGTLLFFGVVFVLILAFVFALFSYGHKRISFAK